MTETDLNLPHPEQLLRDGATLVISISGGKDSQAMLKVLLQRRIEEGWSGDVVLFHNDLGRAEWPQTPAFVHKMAADVGLPLVVRMRIREGHGFDLFDEIDLRRINMDTKGDADKPHWPSSATRFCTKHQKEQPCDTWIRETFPRDATIVVAMGLRDEESTARAKKPDYWQRESYAPTLNRHVYSWLPIRHMTKEDVWQTIHPKYTLRFIKHFQNGIRRMIENGNVERAWILINRHWVAHPAYALGNERLSCSHCVLASENDLLNGASNHTEAYRWYTRREMETGFSFRNNLWLMSLRPDLLDEDVLAWGVAKGIVHAS